MKQKNATKPLWDAFVSMVNKIDPEDFDKEVLPDSVDEENAWNAFKDELSVARKTAPKLICLRVEGTDRPGIVFAICNAFSPLNTRKKVRTSASHIDIDYVHITTFPRREFKGKFYFSAEGKALKNVKNRLREIGKKFEVSITFDKNSTPEETREFEQRKVSCDQWQCSFVGDSGYQTSRNLKRYRRFRIWGQNEPGIIARVTRVFAAYGINLNHLLSGSFPNPGTDSGESFTSAFFFNPVYNLEWLEIDLIELCKNRNWDWSFDVESNPKTWTCKSAYKLSLFAYPDDDIEAKMKSIFALQGIEAHLKKDMLGPRAMSGEEGFEGEFIFTASEEQRALFEENLKLRAPCDWDWDWNSDEKILSFQPLQVKEEKA